MKSLSNILRSSKNIVFSATLALILPFSANAAMDIDLHYLDDPNKGANDPTLLRHMSTVIYLKDNGFAGTTLRECKKDPELDNKDLDECRLQKAIQLVVGTGPTRNPVVGLKGDGTIDPDSITLGELRRSTLELFVSNWEDTLDSNVPVEVNIAFADSNTIFPDFPPGILGCGVFGGATIVGGSFSLTAGADFPGALYPKAVYVSALANKLADVDLTPGTDTSFYSPTVGGQFADFGNLYNEEVDSSKQECIESGILGYYYGMANLAPQLPETLPPSIIGSGNRLAQIGSVIEHELGHGLGFQIVNYSIFGDGEVLEGNFTDPYAVFLLDKSIGLQWNQMNLLERVASSTGDNLFWLGPNATSAADMFVSMGTIDGLIKMYAPTTLRAGSSLEHFDFSLEPNLLMEPFITKDTQFDPVSIGALIDIGWDGNLHCPIGSEAVDMNGVTHESNMPATVMVGNCDSGVANQLGPYQLDDIVDKKLDAQDNFRQFGGCTIGDLMDTCLKTYGGPPQLNTCRNRVTQELHILGVINGAEKDAIEQCF